MSETVVWPERPICHGDAPQFSEGGVTWRPPMEGNHDSPYDYPFRTCSYCGSMHPEDLLRVVAAGARLGGSDWKYGWPHKFYVEGIPNPAAGEGRKMGGVGGGRGKTLEEMQRDHPGMVNWRGSKERGWNADNISPAPQFTHAKWYNEHLLDLSPEAFAVVTPVLLEKAGIDFRVEDGRLRYRARCAGYQA